jgi:predicted dehydrogenase
MKLKVGLIGLAHPHAAGHLRELELLDDVEAIYVADADAAALAGVRDRPKVAATFADLDALLGRDDVPVLVVLRRNDESVPAMLRAVEAGKHVIADKPAARTADELARLLDAAARRGVLVSVYYQNRWSPEYRQAARLREAGALGRLLSAEMRMVTTAVALRNPGGWLFSKAAAGGGILHWLGCHAIDLLRFVSGEEVTTVSALVGTLSGEAIDVEDVATVSLRLSGGALATLHAGYLIAGGTPGYLSATYDQYFGVRGTLGRLWTQPGADDLTLVLESTAPGWDHARRHTFAYRLPQSDAYAGVFGMDFLRAFFRAALEGGRPPVTGEDALKVLRIVEAAYRSSATGRTVDL